MQYPLHPLYPLPLHPSPPHAKARHPAPTAPRSCQSSIAVRSSYPICNQDIRFVLLSVYRFLPFIPPSPPTQVWLTCRGAPSYRGLTFPPLSCRLITARKGRSRSVGATGRIYEFTIKKRGRAFIPPEKAGNHCSATGTGDYATGSHFL